MPMKTEATNTRRPAGGALPPSLISATKTKTPIRAPKTSTIPQRCLALNSRLCAGAVSVRVSRSSYGTSVVSSGRIGANSTTAPHDNSKEMGGGAVDQLLWINHKDEHGE
jgi:hypothetical protein